MKVLLDTNVLIKWALDQRLPHRVTRLLHKSSTECYVSIVTPWEIAMLGASHKISLPPDRVDLVLRDLGAQLLPIQIAHTSAIYTLPRHHSDPFDRMLIAQAISEGLALVSSDQHFAMYEGLRLIY